ncbi:DoxX family protein [Occultella kanbiaonis]|uniref:DoxX family protein n=1 Tax=Occultella kanbiaonis TaxID=2675754 RepID=UPI001B358018|nr:DoxX family protein [Occultella kanbiaonis]
MALIVWLVVSFTAGAVTKFMPGETFFGPPYSVKFENWGYPAWFRFPVGIGELVAAVALLFPRLRFLGASLLMMITAGGFVTHLASQDPFVESVSAPLHLVLATILAMATRPVDWREFGTFPRMTGAFGLFRRRRIDPVLPVK